MMEEKNLEQVKELIDRIADSYDLPTGEETEEMQKLTGIDWDAEDLQMMCCEYWSHNSIDETAYLMFHEEYPPVREVELCFDIRAARETCRSLFGNISPALFWMIRWYMINTALEREN